MSILYYFFIERWPIYGNFTPGRFVDLLQKDLMITLLVLVICYTRRVAQYQKWRWNRLKRIDKEK